MAVLIDGVRHTWTGYDGTVWDLSDVDAGIFLTQSGIRGMHMPEFVSLRQSSPALPGSYYRGGRAAGRSVLWPLHIYADNGTNQFIDREAKFWDSVAPGRRGMWSVYSGTARNRRDLYVRFEHSGDQVFTIDPTFMGSQSYALQGVADQPFWEGLELAPSWSKAAGQDYYGGKGPPFYIGAGSILETAEVTNDGDVDTPITWRLDGPFDGFEVGIGGKLLTSAVPVVKDDYLLLRAANDQQNATLHSGGVSTDATATLDSTNWRGSHLPPKATTKLSLTLAGAGKITARFKPYFNRAYG